MIGRFLGMVSGTRRTALVTVGVCGLAMALVGWGENSPSVNAKSIPPFTYINAPLSPFSDNFNPFSPSDAATSADAGEIYEPLLYMNSYTGSITPKLATSYRYGPNHKSIIFTIRKGVKWSDGTAFTANDVAFTFRYILKHPSIDINGLSSMISSVIENNSYEVTVNLKSANISDLYFIGADTPIIPERIWSKISNPATYADTKPVTTGPFLVKSFSPSDIILERNPHYWGTVHIQSVNIPLYLSNNTAAIAMQKGEFAFGQQFIPLIKTALIARNPSHYGYWFPPATNNALYINNATYPYNLPALHWAISDAINRAKISEDGEFGYEPPANSVGLPPLPVMKTSIDRAIESQYPLKYSPSTARKILKKAGFTWNKAGQLVDPRGQIVAPTIMTAAGATDIISDSEIMAQELGAIGIDATVKTPTVSTVFSDLATGSYQLVFEYVSALGGPTAYDLYDGMLNGAYYKPVGQSASTDYERWNNTQTNNLLSAYATTFSKSKQQSIMDQLERIFAKNLPIIPVVFQPSWEEYNTEYYTNFPTAKNPYSAPIVTNWDFEYFLTKVRPK